MGITKNAYVIQLHNVLTSAAASKNEKKVASFVPKLLMIRVVFAVISVMQQMRGNFNYRLFFVPTIGMRVNLNVDQKRMLVDDDHNYVQ